MCDCVVPEYGKVGVSWSVAAGSFGKHDMTAVF